MKDFPFFTTQNGIASLTLKEIPYSKAAYITIRDTQQPEELLEECIAFCKMAGAEEIFASNHSILDKYPLHTQIIRMSRPREGLQDTDAALFPVGEKTVTSSPPQIRREPLRSGHRCRRWVSTSSIWSTRKMLNRVMMKRRAICGLPVPPRVCVRRSLE